MEVRVVSESSSPLCSEADYVRVQVSPDPDEDTVMLATIERVVRRNIVTSRAPARRVKKLIENRPMSLDQAVGFARLYAASKKIPLVLTDAPKLVDSDEQ